MGGRNGEHRAAPPAQASATSLPAPLPSSLCPSHASGRAREFSCPQDARPPCRSDVPAAAREAEGPPRSRTHRPRSAHRGSSAHASPAPGPTNHRRRRSRPDQSLQPPVPDLTNHRAPAAERQRPLVRRVGDAEAAAPPCWQRAEVVLGGAGECGVTSLSLCHTRHGLGRAGCVSAGHRELWRGSEPPLSAGRCRVRGMSRLPSGAVLALMGLLFARTMAWTSSGKTHAELVNNLYSESRQHPLECQRTDI